MLAKKHMGSKQLIIFLALLAMLCLLPQLLLADTATDKGGPKLKVGVYSEPQVSERLATRMGAFVTKQGHSLKSGKLVRRNEEILAYLMRSESLDWLIILSPGDYGAVIAKAYAKEALRESYAKGTALTQSLSLGEHLKWPALLAAWGNPEAIAKETAADGAKPKIVEALAEVLIDPIPAGSRVSYQKASQLGTLLVETMLPTSFMLGDDAKTLSLHRKGLVRVEVPPAYDFERYRKTAQGSFSSAFAAAFLSIPITICFNQLKVDAESRGLSDKAALWGGLKTGMIVANTLFGLWAIYEMVYYGHAPDLIYERR